jgi:hypothetical protein
MYMERSEAEKLPAVQIDCVAVNVQFSDSSGIGRGNNMAQRSESRYPRSPPENIDTGGMPEAVNKNCPIERRMVVF